MSNPTRGAEQAALRIVIAWNMAGATAEKILKNSEHIIQAAIDEAVEEMRVSITEIQDKVWFVQQHGDDLGRQNTLQMIASICRAALNPDKGEKL